MSREIGGDRETHERRDRLAPVIPLFGAHGARVHPPAADASARSGLAESAIATVESIESTGGATAATHGERVAAAARAGNVAAADPVQVEPGWRSTWDDDRGTDAADEELDGGRHEGGDERTALDREAAERDLTRRLRTRALSVAEALAVVAQHDLDADDVDAVIAAFVRRGYLDDAALAEQLVHAGVERKGHGRHVIAQTLARRGIPRDVIGLALDGLPDDDAARALEFARSRARGMSGIDPDAALRRLAGQLARRGYGSAVALAAARQALGDGRGPGRVGFVEDRFED